MSVGKKQEREKMEVWTALIISYAIQGMNYSSVVWFETGKHCEQALRSGLYEVIYDHYEDTAMRCYETESLSKSIKPKLRPNNGEESS